jgi:hypothetical protein
MKVRNPNVLLELPLVVRLLQDQGQDPRLQFALVYPRLPLSDTAVRVSPTVIPAVTVKENSEESGYLPGTTTIHLIITKGVYFSLRIRFCFDRVSV